MMSELKHLQPAQYASWLKKAHDPDWTEHRYRTAQDRAMVSAILDLESAETRVKELETQLEEEATADISINEVVEKYMRDFYVIKAENTALKSENERLDKRIEGLIDKYEGCPHTVDCGCAQDKPSDICAHHAPQLRKALAENERLDKQIARFLEPISDEERRVANHRAGIRCWTKDEVESLIANRLEPKGRPINPPQEPS